MLYNTIVTVIANVEAPDPAEAISRLGRAVEGHGFQVMESIAGYSDAREAEAGTPRDHFKQGCQYGGNPYWETAYDYTPPATGQETGQ